MDDDGCPYQLEDLEFMGFSSNYTVSEERWPCELRIFCLENLHGLIFAAHLLLRYISGTIIIFGLIFNTLAFLVLNSAPLNSTSLSVYLRVLAISDNGVLIFNYGVGVVRGHASSINNYFSDYQWACEVQKVTTEVFFLVSAWLVVALTLERWLVIRCPFGLGYRCSVQSAVYTVVILGIIILPIGLSKIWFAGFEMDSVFGYSPCLHLDNGWDKAVYLYVASVLWVPLVLISLGNVGILYEVWHSARKRSKLMAAEWEPEYFSETHKMTRLLLLLSASYVLMLLPLGIVETAELYWDDKRVSPSDERYISWMKTKITLKWVRGVCFFVYQWNFAFNFFLYCLSGDKFRFAVWCWFAKISVRLKQRKMKKPNGCRCQQVTPSVIIISRAASISSGPLLSEA